MMIKQDDWRLRGQEEYLAGMTLVHQPWYPSNPKNDHDHCEFCWEKFADYDGCLHEDYATEDRNYWLCDECSTTSKNSFNGG